MCPQPAHRRKWSHQPPLARHSTHPEPLGGIAGSMSMSVQHVDFWPRYLQIITSVAETRGFAIPAKESVAYEVGPRGALYVGSLEAVAQEIAAHLTALGANRFDLKYGMGGLEDESLMTNIELYATRVIPRARELPAQRPGAHA